MPTPTPNQGIPIQDGPDPADLPSAQTSEVGGFEHKLVMQFTSEADRINRYPAPIAENDVSTLADVDRVEIWNTASWISLLHRAYSTEVEVLTDQTLSASSIVLQNVTALVAPLPTAGVFRFELDFFIDATTTSDCRLAFTWPAGVTNARWSGIGPATTITAGVGDGVFGPAVITSANFIAFGTSGAGNANTVYIHAAGRLTMGGTAGNLQVQACQNASDASAIVVRTGSLLRVWRTS